MSQYIIIIKYFIVCKTSNASLMWMMEIYMYDMVVVVISQNYICLRTIINQNISTAIFIQIIFDHIKGNKLM